jgi:hypothetical protein
MLELLFGRYDGLLRVLLQEKLTLDAESVFCPAPALLMILGFVYRRSAISPELPKACASFH